MNLLYIIFTLVIGPHNPTGHNTVPPEIPPSDPIEVSPAGLSSLYPNNPFIYQTRLMGIDDRFPVGFYDPDEIIRIAKLNDFFDKLKQVQQKVKNHEFSDVIEDIKKDELINEILQVDEIDRFKIKSGGLFDDWERNI